MSKTTTVDETAATLVKMLEKASQGGGGLASAAALGVAGGAGAVFALEHHGRVKAERAAQRRKG